MNETEKSHPNLILAHLHAPWNHVNTLNLFHVNFRYIGRYFVFPFFAVVDFETAQASADITPFRPNQWNVCTVQLLGFGKPQENWKKKRNTHRILIIFHSRAVSLTFFFCIFTKRSTFIYKLADDVWSVINLNEICWPNSSNRLAMNDSLCSAFQAFVRFIARTSEVSLRNGLWFVFLSASLSLYKRQD